MFFLGISAHLFIYLLVPAFLVVCFYFRGTYGSPEVSSLLPGTTICEHNESYSGTGKTYIYSIKKSVLKQKALYIKPVIVVEFVFPLYENSGTYLSPYLTLKALRAPPVC